MPRTSANDVVKEQRRQLVQQVASSQYFAKSNRLREMFMYVCDRVLDDDVAEIHEQEVGRRVFGRSPDYDTAADNTVRVHASMLRKRVEQYFANEGSCEAIVIEIPRGNYAPVFQPRKPKVVAPEQPLPSRDMPLPEPALARSSFGWQPWLSVALSALLVLVSLLLLLNRNRSPQPSQPFASAPTVRQFWSQLFQTKRSTDLVLGDATLGLYEERTGKTVALSEYYDRSYITSANAQVSSGKLDPDLAKILLLKRQTNYGDVGLLDSLTELAHQEQSDAKVRFARDYSFREIKSDNAVLLGNLTSNPWIEPFDGHQTLHWKFDPDRASYYPVDSTTTDQAKYHANGQPVEGYAIVSLFPNLGGTGTVLIISGTGGSAMGGALAFLTDEHMLSDLRTKLNAKANGQFPYFEALLQIGSRNTIPRDTRILVARPLHQ